LVCLWIPDYEAKLYEGRVRGGNVLVSVHASDGKLQDRAKEILKNAGAEDISSSSEATV
jgi:N-acetylmuramic acid 6-phosphate (MurNAc-6-P) etherase